MLHVRRLGESVARRNRVSAALTGTSVGSGRRVSVERTVYEVEPSGSEWVLRHTGTKLEQRFATREEAVKSGRIACEANAPSRLRVRRANAGD